MGLKKIKKFVEDVKKLDKFPADIIFEKIADAYFEVLEAYAKKKPKNHKEFKKIMGLQLEIEELAKNIVETWTTQLSLEYKVELVIISLGGDTRFRAIGRCIGVSVFIVKKALKNSRFKIFFSTRMRVEMRCRKSYMEKKRISRRLLTSSAQSAFSLLRKESHEAIIFSDVVKAAGIPKSGLCPTGVHHTPPVRKEKLGDEKTSKKKRGIQRMLEGEKLSVEEIETLPVKARGSIFCPVCNLMAASIGETPDSDGRKVRIYKCMKGHLSKEPVD